jgi:hypothetical protein
MKDSLLNLPEVSGWNLVTSFKLENPSSKAPRRSECYASDTRQYGRQRLKTTEEKVKSLLIYSPGLLQPTLR